MEKFTTLRAVAAPLDRMHVDTDAIFPARFMKTVKRSGLGPHLFDGWRYDAAGKPIPDFVLNRSAYQASRILVANENFGCGSSREHAVWALMDFGIRCVVAPSFGDIFYANCLKNGLLPVVLAPDEVAALLRLLPARPGAEVIADLENQLLQVPGVFSATFRIAPFARHCLSHGLDEIALTLERAAAIAGHERTRRSLTPWLFDDLHEQPGPTPLGAPPTPA
ncbi:3-isopropylmalate dehydratase small subunit [Massilia niastensis]|uniref:3-isopropylmalate dehydratase small subunit n=1 Tax=Massilia niastensis TaxID=544911 RepID=UPI00036BBB92